MTTFPILTHTLFRVCAILVGLSSPAFSIEQRRIEAISPNKGITTPGTKVAVFGTGFSLSAEVYFDGLASREIKFIGPTELQVETPYLRPGTHVLQISSG